MVMQKGEYPFMKTRMQNSAWSGKENAHGSSRRSGLWVCRSIYICKREQLGFSVGLRV